MRAKIVIVGCIDVPDAFTGDGAGICEVAERVEFWLNEHLSVEDAINDIASRLKAYPDEIEVTIRAEDIAYKPVRVDEWPHGFEKAREQNGKCNV